MIDQQRFRDLMAGVCARRSWRRSKRYLSVR